MQNISDLKIITDADASDFAKKADLASLKTAVDELDVEKFKNIPSVLNSEK